MSGDGPLRRIAVIGGGVAGWTAALALVRGLPGVAVDVIADPAAPPQLVDLLPATTSAAIPFLAGLGADETLFVRHADALYRLGTVFEGWGTGATFRLTHGDHGAAVGAAPFHLQWLAAAEAGAFGDYSPADLLAAQGRFTHPAPDIASPLARFGYGLRIDPVHHAGLLRALAMKAGAAEHIGAARAENAGGRVARLVLPGSTLDPDIVVDCAGAVADELDDGWEDWSRWLSADRIAVRDAAPDPALPLLDRSAALAGGWRLAAPLRGRTVLADIGVGGSGHVLRQGRRARAWAGNVVAISEAAVAVEPVEALPLTLLHAQVERLVALLPGRACAAAETGYYNRETAAEADRARDFALLPYLLTDRPEPFWRERAGIAPPETLAEDLALFRERGRLPVRDGESFARDLWLQVLIGCGARPRRHDPLTGAVPPDAVADSFANQRRAIAAAVARAPTHAAALAQALAR